MPEKDNPGMGERIQSMVEDAINSMDFEQLNKNITGSIQSVFEELNIQPPAGTRSKVSSTSNTCFVFVHKNFTCNLRSTDSSIYISPIYCIITTGHI